MQVPIPTYDHFQTEVASAPSARFSGLPIPNPGAEQMQQLGQSMQQAGGELARVVSEIQREANVTVAKDVDIQVTAGINEALYNPTSGFLHRRGKDALLEGRDDALSSVKSIAQNAIDAIPNPKARELAKFAVSQRVQHAVDQIDQHAGRETIRYKAQTSDARTQVTIKDAASDFTNEQKFNTALGVARIEAVALGKLQGWDDSMVAMQAAKYQDEAYAARYDAWRVQDPMAAFTHYQRNLGNISPDKRDNIGRQLFAAAAPVMANQLNAIGGPGVATSGSGPAGGNPNEPRGIRNNNPGNIMRGSQPWEGEVQGNDPRYASFSTPEAGIRALGKNLLAYQDKYGLNTVEAIVTRWAPATENDTAAYIRSVSKDLGVKQDAPLDLRDPDTLAKFTRAMIRVENSKQPYTDEQITAGVNAAINGKALPATAKGSANPPTFGAIPPTGHQVVDGLPEDWKIHVVNIARTQSHREMSEARESLRTRLQDATSEYMTNGFATNPPNESEFIRAFGQGEGVKRHREFLDVAQLGSTLQQVKTLPTYAINELLVTSKPQPGDGFATRQRNYEILIKAVDQVTKARTSDPVGYAMSTNSYGIRPIDRIDDPRTLIPELQRRASAAEALSADYGTAPQVLSKQEAKVFSVALKSIPVEQQKDMLATLYKGIGHIGLFKSAMQSIAPDTPTVAVAGIYQARGLESTQGRNVSELILRGTSILSPNKKEDGDGHMGGKSLVKMPEEKLLLSDWISATGDAFKGKEQAADLFMQTSKAIYAAMSAEDGDYSGVMNSKRWKTSIMLATGGIESHNGSEIVVPYGWDYSRFQNELKTEVDNIANKAVNTTPREMMRLPLENLGNSRYIFRRGSGYLVDKNGRPVVVTLNGGL